jgi:probable HAF family extracellular repeat protein
MRRESVSILLPRRDALRWLVGAMGGLGLLGCGGGGDMAGGETDALATPGGHDSATTPVLQSATRYRLTPLGRLHPDLVSFGAALNRSGQATGSAGIPTNAGAHAFLYTDGSMQDLGPSPDITSGGTGINDSGQVCGSFSPEHDVSRAFLYSSGVMQDIGTLGGRSAACAGINTSGQITGWSEMANGHIHAFLYIGGSMQDLGTLGDDETFESFGAGINDAGHVVGFTRAIAGGLLHHAFVVRDGRMEDLGVVGGAASRALAINARGEITGGSTIAEASQEFAFLFSGGEMRSLGTLGGSSSIGRGINAAGWVVGDSGACFGTGGPHAFLYDGTAMHDLNNLLDSSGEGREVNLAAGINDVGQIVGTANGTAVLLTPVPS